MKNKICENCETTYNVELEFCPKCGIFNVDYEDKAQNIEDVTDNYNPAPQAPIEEVVRRMADNINTIKSILVFFTWLWGIGAFLWVILMLFGN